MTQQSELDASPHHAVPAAAGPPPPTTPAAAPRPTYCAHCGEPRPAAARYCPSCGKGEAAAGVPADRLGRIASHLVDVLRSLGRDPIAGLPSSYARVEPGESWWASGALLVVALLLAVIGITVGAGRMSAGFLRLEVPFFATFFSLLAIPLVLAAGSYGARRLAVPGEHTPRADLFTAAAALVPIGIALFLSGLLGMGNAEVAAFLVFCAGILSVLMLFTGWTAIGGLPARFAAWLLPVLLALSLWASKVILFALAGF